MAQSYMLGEMGGGEDELAELLVLVGVEKKQCL